MALNDPYGGKLVDLMASAKEAIRLKKKLPDLKTWYLTPRQICDAEMLLHGAFSPLSGFLGKQDYERVCKEMRLTDGTLWPMPVTLDVDEAFAKSLKPGEQVALRDQEGVVLAVLTVGDVWKPDKRLEAQQVFGTTDTAHPAVDYLLNKSGEYYAGGKLTGLELPAHYDFKDLRLSPKALRERFNALGWERIVAFQTRNPMHRAHVELTMRAAKQTQANLLVHPVVGMTKPGDVDHYTRVRVYQRVIKRFPAEKAMLSLLPLAMRMGGPREVLWHMIIRKNFGVSHFIVGRDHAGPGRDSKGENFYGPYDSQQMAKKYASEIGIEVVPFQMMAYVPDHDAYFPEDELPDGAEVKSISGTELRAKLANGDELPAWFTYPEVAEELRRTYRPRDRQGFVVFFTGLSGAGKSTVADALLVKLMERGSRSVTLLDGDIVRKHLSSELGFSKEHRDLNIRRIGYVAAEIAKHGGIAICAPIAPYDAIRKDVRNMVIAAGGGFILVHMATPIEVCEQRDRKGLYAAARAGTIKEFTGVSDPYEEPSDAELTLDTDGRSVDEVTTRVLRLLETEGYLARIQEPRTRLPVEPRGAE